MPKNHTSICGCMAKSTTTCLSFFLLISTLVIFMPWYFVALKERCDIVDATKAGRCFILDNIIVDTKFDDQNRALFLPAHLASVYSGSKENTLIFPQVRVYQRYSRGDSWFDTASTDAFFVVAPINSTVSCVYDSNSSPANPRVAMKGGFDDLDDDLTMAIVVSVYVSLPAVIMFIIYGACIPMYRCLSAMCCSYENIEPLPGGKSLPATKDLELQVAETKSSASFDGDDDYVQQKATRNMP